MSVNICIYISLHSYAYMCMCIYVYTHIYIYENECKHIRRPTGKSFSGGNSTTIARTAVRKGNASGHHWGPIDGPCETFQSYKLYSTAGFERELCCH